MQFCVIHLGVLLLSTMLKGRALEVYTSIKKKGGGGGARKDLPCSWRSWGWGDGANSVDRFSHFVVLPPPAPYLMTGPLCQKPLGGAVNRRHRNRGSGNYWRLKTHTYHGPGHKAPISGATETSARGPRSAEMTRHRILQNHAFFLGLVLSQ